MPKSTTHQQANSKSPSKRMKARRRSILLESLESRWLMASDILIDVTTRALENDAAIHQDVSKQLASLGKATHFFQAGDEHVGLVIAGDRIALKTIDAVNGNPELMAEWGLRASRPLGADFLVYESTSQLDQAFIGRLIGSGLVEKTGTVFRNTVNGTEAVLLNEAIVSLKSGMTADRFFENRPEFLGHRALGGTPDQFIVTLAAGYGEQALEAVNALSNDPGLNWTAPNFHQAWQKLYFPNDSRFVNLWHLHNTGQGGGLVDADPDLPEAWDVIPGGSTSLVIGIVDDGVSNDHPDLNPWVNVGETPSNGIDDDGNGWVDDVNGWNFVNNNNVSIPTDAIDGHGTAVAGVAAARGDNSIGVTGASYNTRVLSSRIFAGNSVATDAGIAEAIYYAAGRNRDGIGTWQAGDLSNHSWGGGAPSTAINDALTWATSQGRSGQGSLQVFAAGNSGAPVGYPATQAAVNSGIAVVGAVNNFGTVSSYSSFGPLVDVVAPSDNFLETGFLAIDTTDRIGADGYSTGDYTGTGAEGFGGTSSAAPLATGIMALAIARGQSLGINLSPTQLRSLMRVNTELLPSEDYDLTTGQSENSGYGRINAASLVSAIGSREISVQSEFGEVASGTTTIELGSVYVGNYVDATFRIRNQGTVALNLTGLTVEGDPFSISQVPTDLNLDLGEFTTFSIRFSPTSDATTINTVSIFSNDSDEAIFSFSIRGIGNIPNVTGNVFEDWDGDALYDYDDPGIANHVVFLDTNLNGTLDSTLVPFTSSTTYPILDNQTLLSPINVSGLAQSVADINVTFNATHTWVSDLEVVLIGPNAVRVPLVTRRGGSGDNFTNTTFDDQASTPITGGTAPFTGSFRPESPLSVFNGINPNGTWTLEIQDVAVGDTGTLLNWTINVGQSEPTAVTSASGNFIFDDLAAGTYRLVPTPRSGFSMTTVNFSDFTIALPSDYYPGLDFGFSKANRFYGKVFEDRNADGVQGVTENGLSGQFLVRANSTAVTNSFSSTASVPIVDRGLAISEIAVTDMPSQITDVNVTLNITHTFDADLEVFLHAPDGTIVELFTQVGGSGDNFTGTILDDSAATSITAGTAPFTGTFRPEGVLAGFNGRQPNGTWKLYVYDVFGGDVGSIQNWSLQIVATGDYRSGSDSFGRAFFDLPNGTHTVTLQTETGIPWVYTVPSTGQRTVTVPASMFSQTYGVKRMPEVNVDSSSVTGVEGTTIQQTGTWFAPYDASALSLSSSVGTVTKNASGTWSWSIAGTDDVPATTVTITANDGLGSSTSVTFTYSVTNANPTVTVGQSTVSGNVLSTLTNTGTWADVPSDTVALAASLGTVTKNADGTWAWSFTPSQAYTNQTVTITATDEDGGSAQTQFKIDALVAVVNSKVYYKGSSFAGTSVDAALDTSKVIAKSSGAAQQLAFANLINTTRGINGLVFDVAGLAAAGLIPSDFVFRMSPTGNFVEGTNPPSSWATAPAPTLIDVTAGNATTAARVRLEWADNAIANRWLQIKVLANANTGLATPQVFYIGHLLGETNGLVEGPAFRVRGSDTAPLVAAINNAVTVPVNNVFDLLKDGRVRGSDASAAVGAVNALLTRITIPVAGSADEGEGGAGRFFAGGPALESAKDNGRERSQVADARRILPRRTDERFDVPLPAEMVRDIAGVVRRFWSVNLQEYQGNSQMEQLACLEKPDRNWTSVL